MGSDLLHHVVGSQLAHLNIFVLWRWLQAHALLCRQCRHSRQRLGAFGHKVGRVPLNPVSCTRVLRHRVHGYARCIHLKVARRRT